MVVQCLECGVVYDDIYRFTYCPHSEFEMFTRVYRGDGSGRVCRSVEEARDFLDGKLPADRA